MNNVGSHPSSHGLDKHGVVEARDVHWNLSPAQLYEQALVRGEAQLAAGGPLVARTGKHTGRAPGDRYVVREGTSESEIWWGKVNREISEAAFDRLHQKVLAHYRDRDLFVFNGYAGADPSSRMRVRVVSELAWHNLFARNMFIREVDGAALAAFDPAFTVLSAPNAVADPETDETNSSTFVVLNLAKRLVIIGGTHYAGEIKKSIFSVMNYRLPKRGVLSMHCSANYGRDKSDVALFFGLSGTGKTTLSADSERTLIGDDEHGWGEDGVFNIEGGCYAKVIRLSAAGEPEIYATTRRFGTILENVIFDPDSRELDLDDDELTENTRSSYPLTQLSNADLDGRAGAPRNVVFLTCDAFGVLPPISRLSEEQASYHFLSGYTAKVAGTELGVDEPTATFSACFGAPFMPLHPGVYAEMLAERIRSVGAQVWLINTGWTGGAVGIGKRCSLAHTRRMVSAALKGELSDVETTIDPIFGVAIPNHCEGVPADLLFPRRAWPDAAAYEAKAKQLATMFRKNFEQFADGVSDAVAAAGPR